MENSVKVKMILHISAVPEGGGEPICWYDSRTVSTANEVALPKVTEGLLGILYAAVDTVKKVGDGV